VFFESSISGFGGGRMVNRADKRIEAAHSWLDERVFDGGTNLFGGLEEAFTRKDLEEIILLTDGMPSAGEVQDPHRILAWVQRWNRWRKVRISTIGLSAPRQADGFLAKLAEQNRGVYRAIR
jgi:Mg-chelatase subunit ChlD